MMQQLRGVQIRKYIPPHAARPLDPHVHPTIHPSAYLCPRPHTCHQYLCLRCSHAPSHDHDPTAAKHTHITHPYRQLHRPCYSIKLLPHLHCISDAPSHVVFVFATGGSPGMGGAPFTLCYVLNHRPPCYRVLHCASAPRIAMWRTNRAVCAPYRTCQQHASLTVASLTVTPLHHAPLHRVPHRASRAVAPRIVHPEPSRAMLCCKVRC